MSGQGEGLTTRRRAAVSSLLFAVAAWAAPAGATDDATLRTDAQTAASWAGTAAWLGESWRDRRLPSPYVTRTLRLAGEALDRAHRTIAKDLDGRPDPGDLAAAVAVAKDGADRLNDAIGRNDPQAIAASIGELRRMARRLQVVP